MESKFSDPETQKEGEDVRRETRLGRARGRRGSGEDGKQSSERRITTPGASLTGYGCVPAWISEGVSLQVTISGELHRAELTSGEESKDGQGWERAGRRRLRAVTDFPDMPRPQSWRGGPTCPSKSNLPLQELQTDPPPGANHVCVRYFNCEVSVLICRTP